MPTYAYGCDNCGVRFDRYQSFDAPPLTECPECGEPTLRKLYQPVGIVFKGSGFYSTDHRSPSGQGAARKSEDKSEATAAKSDADTKKDTSSETA
ncbi:MAG TPA: FmdB family zinc ribbon protein [Anaerolineales bacterium]|nr:FmdB family zinc ribbon protein [Anaerolineales bacterium]